MPADTKRLPRKHLLAVGLLSVLVAAATILTPSGDVNANREDTADLGFELDSDILQPIAVNPRQPL
ncbi:MAG: hypothetical protein RLP45_04110, partial [Haliea sp.]